MSGIPNMSSLLSANIAIKQAEVQGNARHQMNTLSDINKQIEKDAKEAAENRIEERCKADKEWAKKLAEKHMDEKKEAENQIDIEAKAEPDRNVSSESDQPSVNVLV